jgi:hypothetical protein
MKRIGAGWILLLLAAIGCAQVEPPSGGPEDRTLPRVAEIRPDSGKVGVRPDTISVLFSKPMDHASVRDWTFISPPIPIREIIWSTKSRADLILSEPPDTGKTYSILLGAEVVDRRKNSIGPWSAPFSTGARLDDGSVEGTVIGHKLHPAGAYVYVWPWSDSLATTQQEPPPPLRMSQAGKDGAFRIQWLPRNEPLRICALYDAAHDRSFDSEDDAWGCTDAPVVLSDTSGVRKGLEIYVVLSDETGILKGSAVDSSCTEAGEVVLKRLAHEADSLSALVGITKAPKAKSLADTLYGFGPGPRRAESQVDSLAVRAGLARIDSLRVLARVDSVRCALPIIVRIYEKDTSLVAEARGKGSYEFRDIVPGAYRIRGFRDGNGNGLADPGELSGAYPDSVRLLPGRTVSGLDFPLKPMP